MGNSVSEEKRINNETLRKKNSSLNKGAGQHGTKHFNVYKYRSSIKCHKKSYN